MIPKRIIVQSATFDVDFCNFFSSFSIECSGGAIKTDSLDLMVPLQTLTSSYSLFSPAFSSRFVDTVAKYTGLRIALSVGKTDLPEDVKYYLGDDASNSSLDVIYITYFLKEDLLDLTMAFVPAVCSGLVNQPDLHFNSILAKFAHQLLKTPALAQVFSTKESTSGVFLDLVQFSMDAYNALATSANSNTDERPAQDCFRWLRVVLNFLDSEAEKFSCAATGFAFRVLPHAVSSDRVLAEQTRPMMCLSPIAKTTVLHREEEDNYEFQLATTKRERKRGKRIMKEEIPISVRDARSTILNVVLCLPNRSMMQTMLTQPRRQSFQIRLHLTGKKEKIIMSWPLQKRGRKRGKRIMKESILLGTYARCPKVLKSILLNVISCLPKRSMMQTIERLRTVPTPTPTPSSTRVVLGTRDVEK
ncbi:uncharacterized protein LOC135499572 [Lineus longissimus]|uniref:uncharacterized protein LOC135499572 n=1 Tax=Lineus longissimus TaxID=88925 RepID=UPI002B4E4009